MLRTRQQINVDRIHSGLNSTTYKQVLQPKNNDAKIKFLIGCKDSWIPPAPSTNQERNQMRSLITKCNRLLHVDKNSEAVIKEGGWKAYKEKIEGLKNKLHQMLHGSYAKN